MYLSKVLGTNFRNYSQLEINLNPRVNIFFGDNGQGKTNLLEGIYLSIKGDSFRPSKSIQWKMENSDYSFFKTDSIKDNGTHDRIEVNILNSKKTHKLNSKTISSSKLALMFPIILFSPESLYAIKDGPQVRRQLLDDYLKIHSTKDSEIINKFNRVLKTRNKILMDGKKGFYSSEKEFNNTLESIWNNFILCATDMAKIRIELIKKLEPEIITQMKSLFDEENVDISVEYLISDMDAKQWNTEEIINSMSKRQRDLDSAEKLRGISLVGPHKHDLKFKINGMDARFYCSQGQQRSLILSFKMAQIMYHYKVHNVYPVLLLDDVLSELDIKRRDRLIKVLSETKAQILITTTDLAFSNSFEYENENLSLYKVNLGSIDPIRW